MPHRSSVPMSWRLQKHKYQLAGAWCEGCNRVIFPAEKMCGCGKETKECVFSGLGTTESFTVIRTAPAGFEHQVPYVIALVRLDEGPLISTQLVDKPCSINIGDRVRSVFRRLYTNGEDGLYNYGFKFELIRKINKSSENNR